MNLESLLKLNRTIRVIGFDDAPFIRGTGGNVSIAGVLQRLTDCGKVPEALRLAHLITSAVMTGESSSSA